MLSTSHLRLSPPGPVGRRRRRSTQPTLMWYTLTGLKKFKPYYVQILATTVADGNYSEPLLVTTQEDGE